MSVVIRPFEPDDSEAFLSVHHAAVRVTAAKDYPSTVIDAWAPPIDAEQIARVMADQSGIKLVALEGGEIVGIGETVPAAGELRACYVAPARGGHGIGRAIVAELDAIARAGGATSLWLDSSLTAEAFYARLGYEVVERGEHTLGSGARMACVKMTKRI